MADAEQGDVEGGKASLQLGIQKVGPDRLEAKEPFTQLVATHDRRRRRLAASSCPGCLQSQRTAFPTASRPGVNRFECARNGYD